MDDAAGMVAAAAAINVPVDEGAAPPASTMSSTASTSLTLC